MKKTSTTSLGNDSAPQGNNFPGTRISHSDIRSAVDTALNDYPKLPPMKEREIIGYWEVSEPEPRIRAIERSGNDYFSVLRWKDRDGSRQGGVRGNRLLKISETKFTYSSHVLEIDDQGYPSSLECSDFWRSCPRHLQPGRSPSVPGYGNLNGGQSNNSARRRTIQMASGSVTTAPAPVNPRKHCSRTSSSAIPKLNSLSLAVSVSMVAMSSQSS